MGGKEPAGNFCAEGLRTKDGTAAPMLKRSSRGRGNGGEGKGGVGKPVNCCTIARKLEVSVLRTVVGARLDALDLFLGPRGAAAERSPCTGGCTDEGLAEADADAEERAAVMAPRVVQVEYEDSKDGWIPFCHAESRLRELDSGVEKGKEAR